MRGERALDTIRLATAPREHRHLRTRRVRQEDETSLTPGNAWRPSQSPSGAGGTSVTGTTQRHMHLSPAALDAAIRLLASTAGPSTRGNLVATATNPRSNY